MLIRAFGWLCILAGIICLLGVLAAATDPIGGRGNIAFTAGAGAVLCFACGIPCTRYRH